MKSNNQLLLLTIQNELNNKTTEEKVIADFTKTFKELGSPVPTILSKNIIYFIKHSTNFEMLEDFVNKCLEIRIEEDGNKPTMEHIKTGLEKRVEIIFDQLSPFLSNFGKTIDYGCGSGILAQMIYDRCGIHIDGVDVRNFLAWNVSIPFYHFDGYSVPVSDKYYQSGILTNVLHHEVDNENILRELDRIVSKKLVIIETVPEADNEEDAKKDFGRMLLNDTLWNRFFNYADIPVPGTYEIPSNWIKRFEKYGWKCTHSEDLGFDQPTIQDRHHLFVFER